MCQEPLIGNGGKCPSYKLRSASSYCFCLFLEKQRLGTEESVDFLENVYFDCLTSTNPQVFSWIHPCHPRTAYTHMGCFLWLSLDVIFVYLLHLDEYLFTFWFASDFLLFFFFSEIVYPKVNLSRRLKPSKTLYQLLSSWPSTDSRYHNVNWTAVCFLFSQVIKFKLCRCAKKKHQRRDNNERGAVLSLDDVKRHVSNYHTSICADR